MCLWERRIGFPSPTNFRQFIDFCIQYSYSYFGRYIDRILRRYVELVIRNIYSYLEIAYLYSSCGSLCFTKLFSQAVQKPKNIRCNFNVSQCIWKQRPICKRIHHVISRKVTVFMEL